MPHHARVTVPAEHAAAVADSLLAVYTARAYAVAEYAERPDAAKLQECRSALADAEAALEVLGWDREPRFAAVELTGTSALVGEVLSCAVVDAAQAFGTVFAEYGRGEAPLPAVEAAGARVGALLRLFAAYEREETV